MHKKPTISIIAAIGENRELGKDNKLLWHIPEDLKRFKKLTQNHAVIMGRKTYESIGKPLPDRLNIIITRDKSYKPKSTVTPVNQLTVVHSLEQAIELAKKSRIYDLGSIIKDEIFVIGGGQIFELAFPYAEKLYLTIVEGTYDADTFFPDYSVFNKIVFEQKGEDKGYRFRWIELER